MDKADGGDAQRTRFHRGTEPPPTLADLGISNQQSHRWQQEAALSEELFEAYLADTRAKGHELTSAGVSRLAQRSAPVISPPAPQNGTRSSPLQRDIAALCALFERVRPRWDTLEARTAMQTVLRRRLATLDSHR
jgi:hypothetical protein